LELYLLREDKNKSLLLYKKYQVPFRVLNYSPPLKNLVHDARLDFSNRNSTIGLNPSDYPDILCMILVSGVIGVVFGCFWFKLLKRYSECMVWFSIHSWAFIMITGALICFFNKKYSNPNLGGIFIGLFGMVAIWLICVRKRFKLAQTVIAVGIEAVRGQSAALKAMVFISILSVGWLVFWSFVYASVYYSTTGDGGVHANRLDGLAYFLLIMSLYWTIEVLRNIGSVTTSGIVASWWYKPTITIGYWSAWRRASTYSLGSVCEGSLFVGPLHGLRQFVHDFAITDRRLCNDLYICFFGNIFAQILHLLNGMIRFYNMYGFSRVAIYGTKYLQTAKETWDMLIWQRFEKMVSDDITGLILSLGCLSGGVVSGITCGIWAHYIGLDGWFLISFITFVMGYLMVNMILTVVHSSIATTYVVWAEDSACVSQTQPIQYKQLYDAAQAYHQ